jgi:hypothetical protein
MGATYEHTAAAVEEFIRSYGLSYSDRSVTVGLCRRRGGAKQADGDSKQRGARRGE